MLTNQVWKQSNYLDSIIPSVYILMLATKEGEADELSR